MVKLWSVSGCVCVVRPAVQYDQHLVECESCLYGNIAYM